MEFEFTVKVVIERDTGKFASRDEMADQVKDALDQADAGSWDGENGGEYSTQDWQVDLVTA